jgi:2-polyprenyl-3-methyl-5-hydroxy-6-metoxy-1,4-benzoquinol methylase
MTTTVPSTGTRCFSHTRLNALVAALAFDTRCIHTKDFVLMTSSEAPLTEEQIRNGIRDLAPFHHPVELPYGLNTVSENAPGVGHQNRISRLKNYGWPDLLKACGGSLDGLTVLDCACNNGGLTVEAARAGAKHVLGFDVVERYIEQANFIKAALAEELPQIEFRKMGVEDVSVEALGTFDVTLCFGILYHMQDPVKTMEAIASVSKKILFVGTKTFRSPSRWPRRDVEQAVWRMNIRKPDLKPTTANAWVDEPKVQFEPTRKAVVDLLRFLGFPQVTNLRTAEGGPSGLFLAQR